MGRLSPLEVPGQVSNQPGRSSPASLAWTSGRPCRPTAKELRRLTSRAS